MEDCYFYQLFGGQQQWVVFVRVVVVRFGVILFDELFSVFDVVLWEEMWIEMMFFVWDMGLIVLYVIYDQVEVMLMLDEIVVMEKGWIL